MEKKLKIGNFELQNRIIVGPMAGVSNQGFRSVIKEFGPGLIYTEMTSDKAIVYKNKKTLKMCQINEEERPIALQLFGSDIDTMVEAAKFMDKQTSCDIIDINMGCPVNKVVKNNGGSGLMRNPEYAYQLVKAIVEVVEKPVTVKLRAGWDSAHINVVEMAIAVEKAGASALIIHPRTRTEFYSGHSNWDLIRQVKEAVKIPVIGNGDIKSVDDMIRMEQETNCDGFMVARGCLGNPWLIKQLVHYDQYQENIDAPDYNEKINQCLYHADKLIELKGEKIAIKEMRGHACWYIDGLKKANKVKAMINLMNTKEDLEKIMGEYRKALTEDDFTFFEKDE